MSFAAPRDVLHHVIDNARRDARHVALKDADSEMTYEQLVASVTCARAALVARGVTPGDRVVLLLQNSIEFVIGALASLWIGAIFVPLDATDPPSRLAALLHDCQPRAVVSNGLVDVARLPQDFDRSIFVSVPELLVEATATVPALPIGERPSYIIYTSGTTGTPKGVTVGSSAFEAAVSSSCAALQLDATTRTLSVSPFHFDGSFGTLFTTLASGGTLVIRPRESLLFPRVFFNTVISESVTYTGFSPSYLRSLESDPQFASLASSNLRVIALGGEACSVGDVVRLWSVAPQIRVFNRYGPTETVIAATHFELTPAIVNRGVIPIGKPHRGVEFDLVDDEGRLINEAETTGELYIGGRQLMDGYWNSVELTSEVLRDDFVPGRRLYRTGDAVYVDSDGNYVYVDRMDRVLKRRGVRISLLEIADAFRRMNRVSAATCIAFNHGDALGIAVFVVTDSDISRNDLYLQSRDALPASLIPDRIEIVAAIPVTASGKTDDTSLLTNASLTPLRRTPHIEV